MRSRCAAGHARLSCDDPCAARHFERRCVCLILAVGVHLRYRTSQSTLQPGVFRRHAHSENSNSHTHEMYYQRFVGLGAQLREKQGLQTSTSSSTLTFFLSSLVARAPPRAQVHNAAATRLASWCGVAARAARERARGRVEQRPKAQPRRCRFAALAVAACGAHAHRSVRRVVPRGARSGVDFARLNSPSWRVSRTASGVSGMHGQARARERARHLVHRRRFWRTATRARERVAKRCRV